MQSILRSDIGGGQKARSALTCRMESCDMQGTRTFLNRCGSPIQFGDEIAFMNGVSAIQSWIESLTTPRAFVSKNRPPPAVKIFTVALPDCGSADVRRLASSWFDRVALQGYRSIIRIEKSEQHLLMHHIVTARKIRDGRVDSSLGSMLWASRKSLRSERNFLARALP